MAFYDATTSVSLTGSGASSGNSFYICGSISTSPIKPVLISIASNGGLSFQKTYGTVYGLFNNFTFDTSENLIIASEYNPSPTNALWTIASSGSITSTTGLSGSTTAGSAKNQKAIYDSSGNLFVLGSVVVSTFRTLQVSKYDSSLSLLSQYKYSVASTNYDAISFCLDSSGNMYFLSTIYTAPYKYFTILKTDSSGTISWAKRYRFTDGTNEPSNIVADSTGNIYVAGHYQATNSISYLCKIDSSGTVLWTKTLSKASTYVWTSGLSIDADSTYIYTSGFSGSYSANKATINKYDLSGNLIWQKSIDLSGATWTGSYVTPKGDNYYLVSSPYVSSVTKAFFACLPIDGTKTGTYTFGGNSFVYADGDSTSATGTDPSASAGTTPTKATTSYSTASITATPSNLSYALTTKSVQ